MKITAGFLACMLLMQLAVNAQMKIGNNPTTINNASLLELETTNKGFVLPRVSLTNVSSSAPLPAGLLTGTIVFNTNGSVTGGYGVGTYVWVGSTWATIGANVTSATAWSLTGNAGINAASNFMGTTDGQPLILRTNNTERMRVLSTGNIGIGTTTPPNALSVYATNPLYLSGVQPTTGFTTDSILTIFNGTVKKAPYSSLPGSGAWTTTGNSGTTYLNNFIGTTDNISMRFRTNNVQRVIIDSLGSVGIGISRPPNALSVLATNPLYLSGVQATTTLTTDSILTIKAGIVKKVAYSSLPSGGGTGWLITGNSNIDDGDNFIGTTTAESLVFKVNNVQAGFLGSSGSSFATSFGVGSAAVYQSTAIGAGAQATGSASSLAIGYQAIANTQNAIAIGTNDTASADEGIAIGLKARTNAFRGIAIGAGAKVSGSTQNIAVGYNSNASSFNGIALGSNAKATTNNNTMAIGVDAIATGFISLAIGDAAQSTSQNTTAFGASARATAPGANAFGNSAVASGTNSMVVGNSSSTSGSSSIILGDNSSTTANNSILIGTGLTTSQADALILGNSAKKIGMGTTAPAYKLHIVPATGVEPLYIGGVQQITSYAPGDSVLIIRNGVVKKFRANLSGSDPNVYWSTTGNPAITPADFIGTTNSASLRVRTNNVQRIVIDSVGGLGIGSENFNRFNRERFLVDYGTTTSRTVANFRGNIDSYLQLNIQNTSNGVNASSDFVATADDGTDSTFFIDMGINSSGYNSNPEHWGGAHDGYLYSNSRHLLIGTQAAPSDIFFLSGGGKIRDNTVLKLAGPSGHIIVGKGENTDTPQGNILRGPNASSASTNIAGGSLTVKGGNASGTATGGALNLFGGISASGAAGLQGDVNIQAHNVKAKLGTGGNFLILNNGTPGVDEFVKLQIRETGEVNWYLDGQDLFIRDGFFDAFGTGTPYKYDFMHIDGTTGRIGFNILGGYSDGSPGGETNLPLTSSVTLMGSIATKVRLLNGITSYVIQQDDHILIIDKSDNSNTDMILSPVVTSRGREYVFKRNNNGDGKIIVKPAPGEKLNGVVNGSVTLGNDNSTLEVVCGPDSWWVVSEISATEVAQVTTTSITASDKNLIEVNFTGAGQSIDISLPAAADNEDKRYIIKRNANGALYPGNVLRIVPASGENLDQNTFASPYIMENVFQSVTVRSNGTNWVILNNYNAENAVAAVTTAYTPYKNDKTILADASSASFTVTLPGAATVEKGKTYTVKRTNAGANTVIVDGNGSETMDGIPSLRLNQRFDYLQLQSDGTNWMVISERISPSLVVNPALPYAATVYDGTISSDGNGTINLPSAAAVLGGKIFTIKNSATAGNPTLTVDPNGSETVDDLATWPLLRGEFVTIQSDGTNWVVIGQ